MRSWISLYGLYQVDNSILGGLYVPDGLDADRLKERLLYETIDLELLYTEPTMLGRMIYVWALSMKHSWDRMKEALYASYSPIENYDRNEDWTDKDTRTDNLTQTTNGSTTGGGTVTGSNSTTDTHSAKGYNSGAMVAGEKDQIDTTTSNTTTDSTTNNSTTTNTGTQGRDYTRKGRVHGNIGVTTNQQMINAELELRVNNQMETIIIQQFKQQFCLLVY